MPKDFVSTDNGKTLYRLICGADKIKDQSYFLCQLTQYQLSKTLFPIGHLEKAEVRKIAKRLNMVTAEKKDSQGLCFIGKISLPDFLQQKLQTKKGNIIEISDDFYMNESDSKTFVSESQKENTVPRTGE